MDRRNSNPAALIPDFLPFLRRLEMAVVAFHTFFLSFSNRTPTRFEKLHNFSQYRFRARKFHERFGWWDFRAEGTPSTARRNPFLRPKVSFDARGFADIAFPANPGEVAEWSKAALC